MTQLKDPAVGETDSKKAKEKRIKAWKKPKVGDPHPNTGKPMNQGTVTQLVNTMRNERWNDWRARR